MSETSTIQTCASQTITVPDLGGAENVEAIEILVQVGDTINAEDSLVTLESDKASMEVPSPVAGKISHIHIQRGDKLNEGSALMDIVLSNGDSAPVQQTTAPTANQAPTSLGSNDTTTNNNKKTNSNNSSTSSQIIDVTVPDIGSDSAEVIEILVALGDQIEQESALFALESDKASMELPSPVTGEICEIRVNLGDKISEGMLVAKIKTLSNDDNSGQPDSELQSKQQPNKTAAPSSAENTHTSTSPATTVATTTVTAAATSTNSTINTSGKNPYAGPAVRKLARELGIDLNDVPATGPRGRLQKDDLHGYIRQQLAKAKQGNSQAASAIPAVPDIDYSKFGEFSSQSLDKIARLTANNMHRSWLNVPHVTQFDETDCSTIEAIRKNLKAEMEQRQIKLSPLAFVVYAVSRTLLQHQKFNSALNSAADQLIEKHYIHIGIAVDTPKGLMVPVIKNADKKDLWELGEAINGLALKAREGKLAPKDMQGACFTISSLGAIGGLGFTPIVNTPEVGILGVSKTQIKPYWNGEQFEPRPMLPLALSYDHRVVNGADAGRFLTDLVATLASFEL